MKKLLLALGLSIISMFFFFGKGASLRAFATDNVLDVAVKPLSSSEADAYNNNTLSLNSHDILLQEGDFAVSLVIQNNTGFAAIGYQITYNASLCAPLYTFAQNDVNHLRPKPICHRGSASSGLSFSLDINFDEHIIALGTIGEADATDDGIIVTYFLRPHYELNEYQQTTLITDHGADKWFNHSLSPVSHSSTNGFTLYRHFSSYNNNSWMIGDINDDGVVSLEDAQIIQYLYTHYSVSGGAPLNVSEYVGTFELDSSGLNNADAIFVITVCDVNADGVIDISDAMLVLSYYTTYEVGNGNLSDYTGIIGTNAGIYVAHTVLFTP